MRNLLPPLLFLVVFSFSSSAQIIDIPADYPTIQQGIDAAFNGDTVLVDTGTYIERIKFKGKNITLASKYLTTHDTNYIHKTIIDGDSLGSVISIVNGEDSTTYLSGFTIQNGFRGMGGGIRIIDSSPKIENFIITNNTASWRGGGIYLENSNSRISYSNITNNTINGEFGSGGGIFFYGSIPVIDYVTVSNNIIYGTNGSGGGICIEKSGGVFTNSLIKNNSAFNNELYAGYGGGIYYLRSSTELSNLIIDNNSNRCGGGLCVSCYFNIYPSFSNLQITNNSSESQMGAGVAAWGNIILNSSIIANNNGNGIVNPGSKTYLYNCSILKNEGKGIYIGDSVMYAKVYLYNSIFHDNTEWEIYTNNGEINLYYNNVNPVDIYAGSNTINWHEGNIDSDPLFETNGDFDYYLSNESPCVNAGTPDTAGLNLPEFDIAGNPRIYGNRVDMGALENQEIWVGTSNVNKSENNVLLHPNPASDDLFIEFELVLSGIVSIKLKCLGGQNSIQILNELKHIGQHSIIYNCSQLPPGLYLLRFQFEQQVLVRKFVKL